MFVRILVHRLCVEGKPGLSGQVRAAGSPDGTHGSNNAVMYTYSLHDDALEFLQVQPR